MLGEALAALATAGSTVTVEAMATDVWHTARSDVARLFGRGSPARQIMIEAHLDANAALVTRAENPDEVRQRLALLWQLQLEALLHRHPEVEDELRALVAWARKELAVRQQTRSGPASPPAAPRSTTAAPRSTTSSAAL